MTATASPLGIPDQCKAILLARLSDKREDVDLTDEGIPQSLEDQIQRMRDRAALLGWAVYKVIKNPRLSAYKRRKITLPDGRREYRVFRPDLREALGDLWAGRANALLCLDLDRAFRDPKDLQDLIDVVEHAPHSIVVESCTDSLHMEKGKDNFDAEIRVLVANKASRDTARRVSMWRERQARNGKFGGGRRPFGFCLGAPDVPDNAMPEDLVCAWHGGRDCKSGITTIDYEIDVIADSSHRLLQGISLRALAAELRERQEVPTVTGADWSAQTLRDILLRPRNAGFMVHKKQIIEGVKAPWKPIVSPEVFYAVRDLLTDPSRRTGPGAAPRWHGTTIYRCGICTPLGTDTDADGVKPVTCQVTLGGREPRYKCKDHSHLTRNVAKVDRLVFGHVLYALTHPRAYELLAAPPPEVDAEGLRAERTAIRQRLELMAEDEVLGLKTRAQVIAATKRGNARITEIDELLNATATSDPLATVVNASDPVQAWADLGLADQRLFIDRLCTVTILPSGRRGRGFDPTTVDIAPKHTLGSGSLPAEALTTAVA
ncbi:recombinase family protein [Phytohabitans sp. ZYX-F-186]|uniref:Recombinase family protein n=1 Tax=Phytohabitans maris TaxID=3071409 RepID=A0ABU0ZFZ1_9ACTN|nr:recombinase family protein [Phytohabitans sp. ZYX-F-186]MDQ7905986.1 recombinase family protein [Phytohabitans sp. ZYX-F-186]